MEYHSHSEAETRRLGRHLARRFKPGDIVCLFGDLGSGKTTLVKGVAEGLKVNACKVNSPTFVLMNVHEGRLPMYHFDFYRLEDVEEIGIIGYDEFLYGDGVALVEWAERLGGLAPQESLNVHLEFKTDTERKIRLSARGARYHQLLKQLAKGRIPA